MIHTVKSVNVVNEAEVYVFLEFSRFFYDQTDVGNVISASSAFSKSSLYIWKFLVHALLKPSLKNFEHSLIACLCSNLNNYHTIALISKHASKLMLKILQARLQQYVN